MKLTCEKYLLQSAVAVSTRAAASKSPIPTLEGILLEAGDRHVVAERLHIPCSHGLCEVASVGSSGKVLAGSSAKSCEWHLHTAAGESESAVLVGTNSGDISLEARKCTALDNVIEQAEQAKPASSGPFIVCELALCKRSRCGLCGLCGLEFTDKSVDLVDGFADGLLALCVAEGLICCAEISADFCDSSHVGNCVIG